MRSLLLALPFTLALGVASRLYPVGWPPWDKSLGDAAYAVAVYLGIALLLRRVRPVFVATLALIWCGLVEIFQATGIPAQYAHLGIVRWVLGTTFAWHDLGCYLLGVTLILILDIQFFRAAPAARAIASSISPDRELQSREYYVPAAKPPNLQDHN